jgi:hypothetical protein
VTELTPFSQEALARDGFSGFLRLATLRKIGLTGVPDKPGCYVVLRQSDDPPAFLEANPAGWFRGRDPTIALAELRAAWINGCHTIYIGQSGDIRKRWRTRLAFGQGMAVGAWGGRSIWQLADAENLTLSWRACDEGHSPRADESALLAEFVAHFGKRPFANRRG